MPVKKGRSKSPAVSPVGSPGESPEDSGQDVAEESIFDVSGDETIRVERQSERTGRWEFHGYIPQATESLIAELFGGGKYRVKKIVPNELGRRVIAGTREFSLPGTYKQPVELPGISKQPNTPLPGAAGLAAAAAAGSAGTIDMDRRMSLNETLNHALVSQVLEVMKSTKEVARPSIDWGMILPPVLGVVAQLVERMGSGNRGESETARLLAEQLAEVRRELADLKHQPGPAQNAIGDAVKAIRELLEVRDMIGGVGKETADPDGAMWALGAKVLDVLGKGAAMPTPGATPQEGAPGAPERGAPNPAANLPMWQRLLLHYRGQLLMTVQRGMDPVFVADMAIQFMPPELAGVAMEFVKRPDAAAVATQVIPELREFPKWNAQFWDAFRSALVQDDGEAVVLEEDEIQTEEGGDDAEDA